MLSIFEEELIYIRYCLDTVDFYHLNDDLLVNLEIPIITLDRFYKSQL